MPWKCVNRQPPEYKKVRYLLTYCCRTAQKVWRSESARILRRDGACSEQDDRGLRRGRFFRRDCIRLGERTWESSSLRRWWVASIISFGFALVAYHTRLFYIHSLRYTMAFQSFWNSPCKINFPFPENSVVCLSTFESRCPIVPSDILIVILWFRLLLKKDYVELKLVNSISQRSCSAKF